MKRCSVALCLAIIFFVTPSFAISVLPTNIEKLSQAELVFKGKCVEASPTAIYPKNSKGGMFVTSYTFQVKPEDVIKGTVAEMFTFTQFGLSKQGASEVGVPFTYGMPSYEVGQEYMLFLTSETPIGLRAPVGLGYGSFVNMTHGSKTLFVNNYGNKGLFVGEKTSTVMTKALSAGDSGTKDGAAISFDQMRNVVRTISPQDTKASTPVRSNLETEEPARGAK